MWLSYLGPGVINENSSSLGVADGHCQCDVGKQIPESRPRSYITFKQSAAYKHGMESQYGERRRWSQVINEEPAVPVSIANCHDSDTEPYICTSSSSLTFGSRFCERAIVSDDATDTGMGRTRNAPEILSYSPPPIHGHIQVNKSSHLCMYIVY